jgi:hypothetical protein
MPLGTAPDRITGALLDAEHVALLRPSQRQVNAIEQDLGAELGWLLSPADRLDDFGCDECQAREALDIAAGDALSARDLSERAHPARCAYRQRVAGAPSDLIAVMSGRKSSCLTASLGPVAIANPAPTRGHGHEIPREFEPYRKVLKDPDNPKLKLLLPGNLRLGYFADKRCFYRIQSGISWEIDRLQAAAVGLRSYVAEPDRGRRDWSKAPAAQTPVYANRRRIRGARGRRLMSQRGERIERSFAHLYDSGGMRRTHLRGHTNILKRLLIHAGGFNLGLVMRHLIGSGTPRGLQDRPATVIAPLLLLLGTPRRRLVAISAWYPLAADVRWLPSPITTTGYSSAGTTYTTGC